MAGSVGRSAFISGAGTGIGRALALKLASSGFKIFAAGRRPDPLESLRADASEGFIVPIPADVSTDDGRKAIVEAIKSDGTKLTYIIHNAAILGTLGPLCKTKAEDWRQGFAINVDSTLFLTQDLLPFMEENSRIMFISSGAAHRAIDNWGIYNCTKAAMHMLYKVLRDELKPSNIHVGSVRPGIVDTPMQTKLRSDLEGTEGVKTYEDWFKTMEKRDIGPVTDTGKPPKPGALDQAENVAVFLQWLLQDVSPEEYVESEWDIRDEHHHHRWTTP